VLDRIALKMRTAANTVPKPVIHGTGSEVGLVAIGGTNGAMMEAVAMLKDQGIACDYMRIRGFPFGDEVEEFMKNHERIFVVEQNRDAQLRSMLAIELGVPRDEMTAVLDYAGLPLTAKVVVNAVAGVHAGVQS
jgi:2-oxoglutarate/2-oxoacid ferredoxin oxidoreductase subunit alpha